MNLSMIRGDSARFAFALPTDLTDATVTFTARASYTDAEAFTKTEGDGITVADAEGGLILVELEPTDTSSLASRRHRLVYDIQVQVGTVVSTPVHGTLSVTPDVTTDVVEVS